MIKMKLTSHFTALESPLVLPIVTIALAIAIFTGDTLTDMEIAAPVSVAS